MTVLIVDDHPVVRQGLRVLLEVHDGIDVTGEAADGEEALAQAAALIPDVILLDLKLPGMDGIAVLRALRDRGVASRILVLTSGNDPAQVGLALRSGASGFLYKDVDPDALIRAIRAVNDGNTLLAPAAAGSLVPSSWAMARAGPGRLGRADRPGARGARRDRPRPVQPGDRPPPARVREDGEDPRQLGPGQTGRAGPHAGRGVRGPARRG